MKVILTEDVKSLGKKVLRLLPLISTISNLKMPTMRR